MSFNNFNQDLENEAADSKSVHYKDFPEFENLIQQIESSLTNIDNNKLRSLKNSINQYDNLIRKEYDGLSSILLELNSISSSISGKIVEVTTNYKDVNALTKRINNYLKECELNHEDKDTLNYLKQKESLLIKLIKASLRQFQSLQKRYEALQQSTVNKYGVLNDLNTTQSSTQQVSLQQEESLHQELQAQLPQEQQQSQIQINYEPINAEELEQQTLLIREREREIEQISQDISYINEIYGNLEDIVHEQQFTIDSIEDNVLRYNTDTQGAAIELRRAERYQRRSNGRMLCCFFILFTVLFFIVLVQLIF